jgi:hypothetical protein
MLASERSFRVDAKVKRAESSILSVLSYQVTKCDKGLVVSMHSTYFLQLWFFFAIYSRARS